jgi:hypothetical protein
MLYLVRIFRADGTTARNDGQAATYHIHGASVADAVKHLKIQGYTEGAARLFIQPYESAGPAQVVTL